MNSKVELDGCSEDEVPSSVVVICVDERLVRTADEADAYRGEEELSSSLDQEVSMTLEGSGGGGEDEEGMGDGEGEGEGPSDAESAELLDRDAILVGGCAALKEGGDELDGAGGVSLLFSGITLEEGGGGAGEELLGGA